MDVSATSKPAAKRLMANCTSTSADSSPTSMENRASVTVVISFRERWRFTPVTIESILRNTDADFDLWLLDSGMPDDLRVALSPHVESGALKIIGVGHGKQPNDARALVVPQLESRYVVFVDNDVVVRPGWLTNMLVCAEETEAGIVCPLYLWGDRPESDLIHMAGGELDFIDLGHGLRMTEKHRHLDRMVSEMTGDLQRERVGFGEFHCLMMRREVYSAEDVFSRDVVSVHEHIHASLRARELGYATWIEPEAVVTVLALAPWLTGELSDFRRRWDFADAERSLGGFAARWGIVDDEDFHHFPLSFVVSHVGRADLLDPRPWLGARRDSTMTHGDLQQTFGGWEWLACRSGYTLDEVQLFANAYVVAIEAVDGVYRPCGRPFINHLVGTASVLTFYGCPIQLVLAGLLHAVFSLGEGRGSSSRGRFTESLSRLGPKLTDAVDLVNLYSERNRLLADLRADRTHIGEIPVHVGRILLLEAANEVDMYLSLEVPVSGRTDVLPEDRACECRQLLDFIGLPGLAETLRMARKETPSLATVNFQGAGQGSFRFDGTRIVPAYGQAPRLGGSGKPSEFEGQQVG